MKPLFHRCGCRLCSGATFRLGPLALLGMGLLPGLSAGAAELAAVLPAPAASAPAAAEEDTLRWVVGAKLSSSPAYSGAANNKLGLRPMYALRLGRWRVGTGGMGGLLAEAADAGSGATTDLFRGQRLAASAGLRIDGGRSSGDDAALSGLPTVKRTLRLRLGAQYQLLPEWSLGMTVSQDLLGKGGGANAGISLGTGGAWTATTHWYAGVGLVAGDATYLRARYGVPIAAVRAGRPAYSPGGGLQEAFVGMGTTTWLNPRWAVLTQLGASRLQGPAADSPLSLKTQTVSGGLSLVWRSPR